MQIQTIRDLMTSDPTCCTPQDSITQVARQMMEEDCGAIPVVQSEQNRKLLGIVTDRDITCRIVARELDPSTTTVEKAMSTDVATLSSDATLDECVRLMAANQVRRVPIVDRNGILQGIVAQADLARASEEDEELEDELAEMVQEVSEPAGGHSV